MKNYYIGIKNYIRYQITIVHICDFMGHTLKFVGLGSHMHDRLFPIVAKL